MNKNILALGLVGVALFSSFSITANTSGEEQKVSSEELKVSPEDEVKIDVTQVQPLETSETPSSSPNDPQEQSKQEVSETPAASQPLIDTPVPMVTSEIMDEDEFVPRKGHWITTFGFEGSEYEVPFNFNGTEKNFSSENRALYGARLGFGREFYLGWGFNTTTKLEGFYMGTIGQRVETVGSEDLDEESAFFKKTGQFYGGEASQSLGFIFDLKTRNPLLDEVVHLIVEPYVFAGIGQGRAYNRINYNYDSTISENYRVRIEDAVTISSMGGGINFTSLAGFFLFLKATQYRLDITKRTENGVSQLDGEAPIVIDNTLTDLDSKLITIYSLGGGYKF